MPPEPAAATWASVAAPVASAPDAASPPVQTPAAPGARPSPAAARPRLRPRAGLSLRLRLTLWNVTILAGVLLLFGLSVYAFLGYSLDKEINDSLPQQYTQIRDSTLFAKVLDLSGRTWPFTNLQADSFGSDRLNVYVQIALLNGTVPDGWRSSNLHGNSLPLPPQVLGAVRDGKTVIEEVAVNGRPMRVFSGPLVLNQPGELRPGDTSPQQIIGVIQVARSLEGVENTMALLRLLLIGGGVASLVVAAVAGLALSGAALAPVDRLSQTAKTIGESRDFSRRVPTPTTHDEVGQLADTINEMLARLQEAHDSVETSLQTQRRFVADASHELRTPLTTIRGNVGLLRRVVDVNPEDRAAALADIDSEAERMSRLVSQLLSVARADAGAALRPAPLDLAPVVAECGRQLMLLAGAAGLAATTGPIEPASILGDADGLKQLLLILIDNAVKYTPAPGSIRLSLTRDAGAAVIQVIDSGIGVAPEDQPRIFERFYRADPARSGGGAGLGLAIARWLAEAHGGRLTVESAPGAGSTFRVRVPLLAER